MCISLLNTCFLREDNCTIPSLRSVLKIIPRAAIDQYFLSAGMVQQEMLLEIAVCIGSVKSSTSLLLKKIKQPSSLGALRHCAELHGTGK